MKNENNLDGLRERVNLLDAQLVHLVNERAKMALEIGKLKADMGVKIYDPARERAVLEHINDLNQGPLGKGALEDIFASIMTVCREIQSR